ncbi:MAG: hypothetical protein ACREQV_26995 [Candidatus Binatia bacterium]
MTPIIKATTICAVVAAAVTALVGCVYLLTGWEVPILSLILLPGLLVAIAVFNVPEGHEYVYAVIFSILINFAAGAILGAAFVWIRSHYFSNTGH